MAEWEELRYHYSPYYSADDFIMAGRNIFGPDGLHSLARELGYGGIHRLIVSASKEDAALLKRFAGPHGKTLFAIWKARKT